MSPIDLRLAAILLFAGTLHADQGCVTRTVPVTVRLAPVISGRLDSKACYHEHD